MAYFFIQFFGNLFIIPETAILSTKYLQEAAYDPERRSRKYLFESFPFVRRQLMRGGAKGIGVSSESKSKK
jgi:hypothetical protein